MSKTVQKIGGSRKNSNASSITPPPPRYEATQTPQDVEIARLKQELEIQRLKAELAGFKKTAGSAKTSRPNKQCQGSYDSSSTNSSGSSFCNSSCSSNASATNPSSPTNAFSPFGRPAGSSISDVHSRMYRGKVQGAKWKIIDITAGGVSCDKGVIPFNDFFFSDCKNIIRQYQPVVHLREKRRLAAQPENDRKRKTFLETYTHIEFQTTFRHPELISEPKKKHHHSHHRHGQRGGSKGDKTVHTLPFNDPFNPFLGPRPGGF